MSDILKRIKDNDDKFLLSDGSYSEDCDMDSLGLLDDAAEEIQRLRDQVNQLREVCGE